MPYEYRDGYVYNKDTGKRKNKTPLSRERAMRFMRALYANEPTTKGYDAKAGQTIVGKLMRGGDGKFSSGGTGTEAPDAKAKRIIAEQASKPAPKAGGRRAKLKTRKAPKDAKPKPTEEQKSQAKAQKKTAQAAERTQTQAKNHDAIATALTGKLPGLDFANVMSFANGVEVAPDKLQSALAQGLLEQGTDGTLRLSAAGRGLKQAADRGDIRQALDSLSKGHDAVAKRLATEARRAALRARRKPKSRQGTLDTIARRIGRTEKQSDESRKAMFAKMSGGKGAGQGYTAGESKLYPKNEEGKRVAGVKPKMADEAKQAVSKAIDDVQAKERSVRKIAEHWDVVDIEDSAWVPAIRQGKNPLSEIKAAHDDHIQAQRDLEKAVRDYIPHSGDTKATFEQMIGRGDHLQEHYQKQQERYKRYEARAHEYIKKTTKDYPLITTYKSIDGRPRWLSVTTTAFKDRQAEILSTASLEADVVRSYKSIAEGKTTDHGPLLFWHTPIELGRCDWRAVSGHSLIESGYFHSEKEAKLVKETDQMSPGFYHSIIDPDPSGIFNYIITEERSITPYRRAANPYTLITKEADMPGITEEKAQEYLARGGDPDLLEQLITKQAETEAQLKGLGVAHKDDSAVVEGADDEEEIAEPTGPMFLAEDFEIARPMFEEIITKALAPIAGLLDMEKRMSGHVQALQSGYAKKEAEQQTLAEQVTALIAQNAALEKRVKELEGDIPEGVKRAPVRASEAINTLSGRTKEVAQSSGPMSDGGLNFFNDIIPGMQGKIKQADMLE